MNNLSSISVIICTYNRAHLLKRALVSLTNQTLKPAQFEVIVVDDGSEDDTRKVCDIMRSGLPNLKYIFTGPNVGLARARNIGLEGSSGNYILYTDDDCIPANNWIERLSAVLDREPIVAGGVKTPLSNYFKLCHNIAQFHAFLPRRNGSFTDFIAGANMAFRRSVLEELDGFREDLRLSQDMELILRARSRGYCVFFEPRAVVLHDPRRTTFTGIFEYAAKHASVSILLRNQYRSLLNTPFVLRSPALIVAASPLIALKVTSGIYLKNLGLARHFWTAPVVYALKLAWCWGAARGLRRWNKACEER